MRVPKTALIGFAIGILLLVGGLASLSKPSSPPSSPTLGVTIHPLQDPYAHNVPKQIELTRELGAAIVRVDIHWAWIEKDQPGQEHWDAEQIGRLEDFLEDLSDTTDIEVLAVVLNTPCWASSDPEKACENQKNDYDWRYPPTNPDDYANFLGELVKKYGSRIGYWEIWNEPNFPDFWADPNPEAYTALLKAAYSTIKRNSPEAVVVGGSLAPFSATPGYPPGPLTFLEGMYAAGANGYFDKLSYHPYTNGNSPVTFDPNWPMSSFAYSIPEIRNLMQKYGDTSPIWITELGWTTVPADQCPDCYAPSLPTTEADQAAYLTKAVEIAYQWDYVEVLIWHELVDRIQPHDPRKGSFEYHFGLFKKDFSLKPAAEAFRKLAFPHY